MNYGLASQRSLYRPDIDGLRAVAVLSVIFYHMSKTLLPGGFIGVDVFFVISGFLISDHIFRDLERGRFSIFEFYRRRIKRIAPAMLTVVAVTLFLAWRLMLPEDMIATARSALFSVASLANVYFWLYQDTSYFAPDSRELPLLHLWSLGVEEQFYAIWPLLLMTFYRPARKAAFFVVGSIIAAFSFYLGNLLFKSAPLFSYYMFPTRAGELLMGGLIAIIVLRGVEQRVPSKIVLPMAATGAALLAVSFVFLSDRFYVFPGRAAVPPTLGAALLILSGAAHPNRISRCLSAVPLVWIGLISYSMYLWHWPLLALYRYGYGEMNPVSSIVIFILTISLAWMTYSFIEQPFRRSGASALTIFVRQYATPAGVIAVFSLGLIYNQSIAATTESVLTYRLEHLREARRPAYEYEYVCQRAKLETKDASDNRCVLGGGPDPGDQVLLWGDSNAAHFVGVVGVFAREAGFRFRNLEVAGCPPILSDVSSFVEARRTSDCQRSLSIVRPVIEKARIVIVAAEWTGYQKRSAEFLEAFFETVRELTGAGKQVIIIGQIPIIEGDWRCNEKALRFPFLTCAVPDAPLEPHVSDANEKLHNFARVTESVRYFEVTRYLCPTQLCSGYGRDGEALYYNEDHLTMVGSWKLGEKILATDGVPDVFKQIASRIAEKPPFQ